MKPKIEAGIRFLESGGERSTIVPSFQQALRLRERAEPPLPNNYLKGG